MRLLRKNLVQLPIIFGINYTDLEGVPIKTFKKDYVARGFTDLKPDPEHLYIINAEDRIIKALEPIVNLFWDQDKINAIEKYKFEGSVDEIITEFKNKGYKIMTPQRR